MLACWPYPEKIFFQISMNKKTGIKLGTRDGHGYTAVTHAAANGQYEVVEWLAREGADVRMRSPNGETAEDLARTSEAPGETLAVLDMMSAMATDKLLASLSKGRAMTATEFEQVLAAGADTNKADNSTGLTAVALAAKFGMTEMVKLLAEPPPPTYFIKQHYLL